MLSPVQFADSIDKIMVTMGTHHDDISYRTVICITMYNIMKNNPEYSIARVLIEKNVHNYILIAMNLYISHAKYQRKACRFFAKLVEILKIQLPHDAMITAQAAMENVKEDARRKAVIIRGRGASAAEIDHFAAIKQSEMETAIDKQYQLSSFAHSVETAVRNAMTNFATDEEVQQNGSMLMALLKSDQDLVYKARVEFPHNEEIRKSLNVFESGGRKRFFNT